MNLKVLVPVISIISVAAMVIWGTLSGSYQYSWLTVFAGGIVIAVLSMIENGKKKK